MWKDDSAFTRRFSHILYPVKLWWYGERSRWVLSQLPYYKQLGEREGNSDDPPFDWAKSKLHLVAAKGI